MTEIATLDAALEARADMVGFVVFPKSPRHLDLERARALAARVGARARKVVLSVDADDVLLAAAVEATGADLLQLHGCETPERVRAVRERFGRPVIKALAVGERDDLAQVAAYEDAADMFLFDARPPPGAARPGGNGGAFDWSLMRHLATARPWLLAGGLNEGNVAEALRRSGAGGVDVSSGVERQPGVKDVGMIGRFVAASRAAA